MRRLYNYSNGIPLYQNDVVDGTGQIWLDDVECLGSENSLSKCKHTNLGYHNCGHSEDVGVQCKIIAEFSDRCSSFIQCIAHEK